MLSQIKRICKERKIPICKLEEAVGIGQGSIARWDQHIPSVDKVKAVADYLGVTVDELLK